MQGITISLCVHDTETCVRGMRTVFMSIVYRQYPHHKDSVGVHDMRTVSMTQGQYECLSGMDSVRLLWTATPEGAIKKPPRARIKREREKHPAACDWGGRLYRVHGPWTL